MEAAVIQGAKVEDTQQIATLLEQLGYPSEPEVLREKISLLSTGCADRIWVAEFRSKVVGLLVFLLTPLLHVSGSLGRITALVVDEKSQGKGIRKGIKEMKSGKSWWEWRISSINI